MIGLPASIVVFDNAKVEQQFDDGGEIGLYAVLCGT
jgi:hypothetical protein